MVAFTYRMNAGIPGQVTRPSSAIVEAQVINTSTPPTRYGDPVAYATGGNGGVRPITTGDTAASIIGFVTRPFPTESDTNWPSDALASGPGTPPTSGIITILRTGYISVYLGGSAAAALGGTVYVRVAGPGTNKVIGDIEAAADGSNTIVVSHAEFSGPADANGNVEIKVFIGPQ